MEKEWKNRKILKNRKSLNVTSSLANNSEALGETSSIKLSFENDEAILDLFFVLKFSRNHLIFNIFIILKFL